MTSSYAGLSAPPCGLIDPEALERLREFQSPGGPDVVAASVAIFFSGASTRLEELEGALLRSAPDVVCNAAHALKGSASFLGLVEVVARSRQLEQLGRSGCLDGGVGLLAGLRDALTRGEAAYGALTAGT